MQTEIKTETKTETKIETKTETDTETETRQNKLELKQNKTDQFSTDWHKTEYNYTD